MSAAMTVQTVLYRVEPRALLASARSIGAAVVTARRRGNLGVVTLAHGDASEEALDEGTISQLTAALESFDVRYDYRFFGFNSGSAAGQNLLAAAHPATWHFVTNPDVVLGGGAFEQLWSRTNDDSVGIVESRQLPLELAKHYDPSTGDTSWASGACSLVRGDIWRSIGGYDDAHFFLYGDDVDMSWRVRLGGHRVVHVATSRVFHDKRLSRNGAHVSDLERFHSAVGSFVLAQRWGNDADRERVMGFVAGDEYADVRTEIARLRHHGKLPDPMDQASRVAHFAPDGTIGRWRF
jgi:hypothetical protein